MHSNIEVYPTEAPELAPGGVHPISVSLLKRLKRLDHWYTTVALMQYTVPYLCNEKDSFTKFYFIASQYCFYFICNYM